MKPAPFTWHGPRTVPEAVDLLAQHGSDGKMLAGGQSLLPVLAMRLAEPAHLIDINAVAELDTVAVGRERRHGRCAGPAQPGARATTRPRECQPLLAAGAVVGRASRRFATAAPWSVPSRTPTRPAR